TRYLNAKYDYICWRGTIVDELLALLDELNNSSTHLNIDKSLTLLYTSIGEECHAHLRGEFMRVIHCEQCGTPLPWTAQFCAICGAAVSLHPLISDYPDTSDQHTKRQHT